MFKKRYNVAASRARNQLWVVHSLNPESHLQSADLRRRLISHARDPQALMRLIEEESRKVESEFEKQVLERLVLAGYRVHTQWRVGSAYRIDLVVEGEADRRLAVECDGDRHHGLEQLQRDLERQAILQRLGWVFERIRGSVFFRDPEAAMKPVFEKLDYLDIDPLGANVEETDPSELVQEIRREAAAIRRGWNAGKPIDVVRDQTIKTSESHDDRGDAVGTIVAGPPISANVESSADDRATVEEPGVNEPATSRGDLAAAVPEGSRRVPLVAEFRDSKRGHETQESLLEPILELAAQESSGSGTVEKRAPYSSFSGETGPDPRKAIASQIAEGLVRIISVEGPMLAKRAYDIYLRGCGIKKMGGPLKRSMNEALAHAIRKGQIVNEDESGGGSLVYGIVRVTGSPTIVVRDRGARNFQEIPPSELQLVARTLARKDGLETASDAHLRSVLAFYGLTRLTVATGTRLIDVIGRSYPYVEEIIGTGTTE